MPDMIALRKFTLQTPNGTERVQPSEVFTAAPEQVNFLVSTGRARLIEKPAPKPTKGAK